MAKNTLVRAKILKVNTQFHAGIDVQTCQLLQFFTKNDLRIQKVRLSVSLWGGGERREIQSPKSPSFFPLIPSYPLPFRRQLRRILEKLKSKASTQAKEAFNLYT